jgi:hypothetical protein
MQALRNESLTRSKAAANVDCGVPLDSQYFDHARITSVPTVGKTVVLARFELPRQYCGVLECFSQYTDLFSTDPTEIETPDLHWQLLANRQPLYPYNQLDLILNPWGYGSFPFSIRLPEGSVIEMVVQRVDSATASSPKQIKKVGGRLMGRYWYNNAFGGAAASQ